MLTLALVWIGLGAATPGTIVVKGHALVARFALGPMFALTHGLTVLDDTTEEYHHHLVFQIFDRPRF